MSAIEILSLINIDYEVELSLVYILLLFIFALLLLLNINKQLVFRKAFKRLFFQYWLLGFLIFFGPIFVFASSTMSIGSPLLEYRVLLEALIGGLIYGLAFYRVHKEVEFTPQEQPASSSKIIGGILYLVIIYLIAHIAVLLTSAFLVGPIH